MNIIFLLLATALLVRFFRSGGAAMLKMIGGSPDGHRHHEHAGPSHRASNPLPASDDHESRPQASGHASGAALKVAHGLGLASAPLRLRPPGGVEVAMVSTTSRERGGRLSAYRQRVPC